MQAVKMYTTLVCPYCQRAKMLLKQRGVAEIEEIRVDLDRVCTACAWSPQIAANRRGSSAGHVAKRAPTTPP